MMFENGVIGTTCTRLEKLRGNLACSSGMPRTDLDTFLRRQPPGAMRNHHLNLRVQSSLLTTFGALSRHSATKSFKVPIESVGVTENFSAQYVVLLQVTQSF